MYLWINTNTDLIVQYAYLYMYVNMYMRIVFIWGQTAAEAVEPVSSQRI